MHTCLHSHTYIGKQNTGITTFYMNMQHPLSLSLNSQTDEIPGTSMKINVQCKMGSRRKSILQSSKCTDIFGITNQVTFYRCKMDQFGPFYSAVNPLKKYLSYFTSTTRKFVQPCRLNIFYSPCKGQALPDSD